MNYCRRCVYPENAKPTIIFDDETRVCSGCNYHESRKHLDIDWDERQIMLEKILDDAKKISKIAMIV
jgi:ribosomal protein L37E